MTDDNTVYRVRVVAGEAHDNTVYRVRVVITEVSSNLPGHFQVRAREESRDDPYAAASVPISWGPGDALPQVGAEFDLLLLPRLSET